MKKYLFILFVWLCQTAAVVAEVALWPAYDPETDRYGYISAYGDFVIAPRFTSATSFSDNYAVVTENGAEFYIDGSGKRQRFIPASTEDHLDIFWNGYAVVGHADHYGLIDAKFHYALDSHYSELAYPSASGLLYYGTPASTGLGFLTVKGERRIIPRYPMASEFVGGSAVVTTDGVHFGLINERGHYLISEKYSLLWPLWDGYCMYENEEFETGILDNHGRVTLAAGEYTIMQQNYRLENRSHVLVMNDDSLMGYVDVQGEVFVPCQYSDASEFSEGYASVLLDDGKYALIDEQDNTIFSEDHCRPLTAMHGGLILLYETKKHEFRYYNSDGLLIYMWPDPNPSRLNDKAIDQSFRAAGDHRYPGSNYGLPF